MFFVPEMLGHGQCDVSDPESTSGRLVHLPEYHHHVRQNARILHFSVKLLAFTTAFADAAEDTYARMMPDHVMDHFRKQHGLAHTRATEQSGFAAALQRHQHVDDFDAGLEDFGLGGTPGQGWWSLMHRTPLDVGKRCLAIDRIAENVEHS